MEQKNNFHNIELVSNTPEGKPTVAANCKVLIDGKELKGVKSINITAEAGKIVTAKIEVYAVLSANVLGQYTVQNFQLQNYSEDNNECK